MSKYRCHEIPQPDFEASFTDEMTVQAFIAPGRGIEEAPEDNKQYCRKNGDWEENESSGTIPTKLSELENDSGFITAEDIPAAPTRDSLGLNVDDNPEFADILITSLDSVSNGGDIPDVQMTWLGANVKSVLSFLKQLVDKAYDLTTRVTTLETYPNEYEAQLPLSGDYVNQAINPMTLTTVTLVANQMYLFPFIPKVSFNCQEATIECTYGVTGAKGKIVIYGTTSKRPYTKLFEGAELYFHASVIRYDTSINFNFTKNQLYWIGVLGNSTPTLRGFFAYTCPKLLANISSQYSYIYVSQDYTNGVPVNLDGCSLNYAYGVPPIINFKITSLL